MYLYLVNYLHREGLNRCDIFGATSALKGIKTASSGVAAAADHASIDSRSLYCQHRDGSDDPF